MVDEKVAQRARSGHKCTHRGQGFTARVNTREDALAPASPVRETFPVFAIDTSRMGLIDNQIRVESLTQPNQVGKWRTIAIHAEDAFHNNKFFTGTRLPPERIFEKSEVEVRKDDLVRARQAYSIDEAGVIRCIRKHRILGFQDRAEQTDICGIA